MNLIQLHGSFLTVKGKILGRRDGFKVREGQKQTSTPGSPLTSSKTVTSMWMTDRKNWGSSSWSYTHTWARDGETDTAGAVGPAAASGWQDDPAVKRRSVSCTWRHSRSDQKTRNNRQKPKKQVATASRCCTKCLCDPC